MKYPKTFHLPWSQGLTSKDKRLDSVTSFIGREVVVTEKMDGENTTIYRGGCHARSLDTGPHPSRDWVRALAGRIRYQLPEGDSLIGENVFAAHSILYSALPSYFLLFGAHKGKACISWDAVVDRASTYGLCTVPVLYRGMWDEKAVQACWMGVSHCGGLQEGYVVRLADEFLIQDFNFSVAKFVRPNHVQTDEHWLLQPVVKNGLEHA